ncbi:TRAP transporter small permease [Paracoccus sp. (in: a-proteobacteria)]|uniref:TRAP transporter small permease n=1 Tax=Paracoccus sp. TaxID=267 RepID=UPI002AFF34E6|nr:TRAP transporter small permease [Paracoccus sp. (in: a-proteobacteria)]
MSDKRPASLYTISHRFLSALENIAACIAGVMIFLAMVLTSADVLMRYVFGRPLAFTYHLTEFYLMVGMMVLPFSWGFRTGGYIRVMAICAKLPPFFANALLRLGLFASLLYTAGMCWLAIVKTAEHYQRGDVQMGVIDWPVWLSWLAIPVGLGLLTLRLLLTLIGPTARLNVTPAIAEEGV